MTAFAEYRLCPYEGESLPVDHVCVAGAPRHAGRGAATPRTEINVTNLADTTWLQERYDESATEAARYRELADVWDEVASVFHRRLHGPAVPPPPVNLGDDEPEQRQPLEKAAHDAVIGRDPYSHVVTGLLPQAPGHVHAPGSFDASAWPRQGAER